MPKFYIKIFHLIIINNTILYNKFDSLSKTWYNIVNYTNTMKKKLEFFEISEYGYSFPPYRKYKNVSREELIKINKKLADKIYELKDDLVYKEQQIRYIKAKTYNYGLLEKTLVYTKNIFVKIRTVFKRIFNLNDPNI